MTGKLASADANRPGRLILRVSGSDSNAFPDSSGGARLATRRTLQSMKGSEALVGLDQRVLTQGAFTLNLLASYLYRRDDTANPGVAPSPFNSSGLPITTDQSSYRRGTLQAVARYGQGDWSSAGGVEVQREAGRSAGQLIFFGAHLPGAFDRQRDIVAAFAEGGYVHSAWTISAGMRADQIEALGTHLTARSGVRYLIPATGLALRASAGTGFKAPSFYALGNPLVGNPKLRPERSASGEIGLVWNGDRGVEASATLFHARYMDLIDFDPGPPPQLVNRSAVISKGVSVAVALSISEHLRLNAQTQYVSTVDEAGTQLLNRPRWRATAGISWAAASRLSIDLQSSFVSECDDYSIPTGVRTLAPYHVVSVAGALAVSPSTTLRLAVDNALDQSYEEAVGFPAPAVHARLLLTQRF
jgi:outer membrane cobalamin receptor